MSALKDYLHIVKEGIKNKDKIIEALVVSSQVKNNNVEPEALAEILKRKEICASCPFNSDNAAKLSGYKVPLGYGTHCILCICRIGGEDTKEYCLSCNCGINELNKRNAKIGIPPQPLKWSAFETTNKN